MARWSLDDIPWECFDRSRLDPETVEIIKAACMVEHHSADYGKYLCSVFHDDPEFCEAALGWAEEEIQHGKVLRRYAELADPGFDFEHAFARFVEGHVLPLDATQSVRGSRAAELIARCVVEVGTSSYYSAIRDATAEPVLKAISQRVAGDEFRHYKLFYTHMKRYQAKEHLGLVRRLKVAVGRLLESSDDELAYAFWCGLGTTEPYQRRRFSRAYARRALGLYRAPHVERAVGMVLKAAGISPQGRFGRIAVRGAWWLFRARARTLQAAA